jgi:hypothetical protein
MAYQHRVAVSGGGTNAGWLALGPLQVFVDEGEVRFVGGQVDEFIATATHVCHQTAWPSRA